MIAALPFHPGDLIQCNKLLRWMVKLGRQGNHKLLLIPQSDLKWEHCEPIIRQSRAIFGEVLIEVNDSPPKPFPAHANGCFLAAASYIQKNQLGHWLWCETDSIPTNQGWMDEIDLEYKSKRFPFCGPFVESINRHPKFPPTHLAGVVVFSENAITIIGSLVHDNAAFDISTASVSLRYAARSDRIQHFWGLKDLPPTFVAEKTQDSPVNALTLADIHPGVSLYHRNKDGTLIKRLHDQLFPGEVQKSTDIVVVIPCWKHDVDLAVELLRWMGELRSYYDHEILISCDNSTPKNKVEAAAIIARKIFRKSSVLVKPTPPNTRWPVGSNFSFLATANYIHNTKGLSRPWLWIEPDTIPLREDWLDIIVDEYDNAGKLFMGPIVHPLGHMNGVGVYPPDFPERCPKTMSASNAAWDFLMRDEMIADCHDAGHIIQHLWGIVNNKPHHTEGRAPVFSDQSKVSAWVLPNAAMLHRCKDGSLIKRLRERRT